MNPHRLRSAILIVLGLVMTAASGVTMAATGMAGSAPRGGDAPGYLLAVGLDRAHTLQGAANLGGRVRWIGESSLIIGTDAFGLAAYRGAGFAVSAAAYGVFCGSAARCVFGGSPAPFGGSGAK